MQNVLTFAVFMGLLCVMMKAVIEIAKGRKKK
jgi:hypothetical protein